MKRCREVEYVEFNRYVFKKLTKEEMGDIGALRKEVGEYYGRNNV
jgi:hypothetical protein